MRIWLAMLVATMLAATLPGSQTVSAGDATVRAAAFDPFAVLCTHDGGRGAPAAPAPHRHDGGCCLAGCAMGAALPPPAPASPLRRAAPRALPRPRVAAAPARDRRPAASPLTIRGPPGLA